MVRAAIDVGSNSVILTVAESAGVGWNTICETTEVTALGEATRSTRLLSERGMSDSLAALKRAFDCASQMGAESISAAVTMAGRLASNTQEFLQRAYSQGTPVEVLCATDEAEFGFRAVAEDPIFANLERISVIDVGGHSTELATGSSKHLGRIRFCESYSVGTLGLRDGLEGEGAVGPGTLLKLSNQIDDAIGLCYLPDAAGVAVSLGATGVNLASVRAGGPWSAKEHHGATLGFEEVARATGWLCSLTDTDRASLRGIEPGRERTLHLGALILERFLYALRVDECMVSNRGWRFGLLERPFAREGAHCSSS